jgi:hypothetical protein
MSHHVDKIAPPAFNVSTPEYSMFDAEQFKTILRLFFNRLIGIVNILIDNSSEALYTYPVTDATTARTVTSADRNKLLTFTSSSAVTVTVPSDTTEPLEPGFRFTVFQDGTGTVTVAAGAGATLRVPTTASTSVRYASRLVVKTSADTWTVMSN